MTALDRISKDIAVACRPGSVPTGWKVMATAEEWSAICADMVDRQAARGLPVCFESLPGEISVMLVEHARDYPFPNLLIGGIPVHPYDLPAAAKGAERPSAEAR